MWHIVSCMYHTNVLERKKNHYFRLIRQSGDFFFLSTTIYGRIIGGQNTLSVLDHFNNTPHYTRGGNVEDCADQTRVLFWVLCNEGRVDSYRFLISQQKTVHRYLLK